MLFRSGLIGVVLLGFPLLGAAQAEGGQALLAGQSFVKSSATLAHHRLQANYAPIAMELPKTQPITINNTGTGFSTVYHVREDGEVMGQTLIPTQMYRPPSNAPLLLNGGAGTDSLNPYGSSDLGEALINGALNTLFSKIAW
ncbi:MAG: hypothetical protein AAGB22_09185 [Bacteroidota bacterium]